jgi:excisionase family DNA binding protein
MTKLITIPRFAQATGLPYRLCLQLVSAGSIPSVPVGSRRRIDVRWVEQWLSKGGYRPPREQTRSRPGGTARGAGDGGGRRRSRPRQRTSEANPCPMHS